MLYVTMYLSAMKYIYVYGYIYMCQKKLCILLESTFKVLIVIGCLLIKMHNPMNVLAAFLCDMNKYNCPAWQEQDWTVNYFKNFEVMLIVKENAHTWTRRRQSVKEVV